MGVWGTVIAVTRTDTMKTTRDIWVKIVQKV